MKKLTFMISVIGLILFFPLVAVLETNHRSAKPVKTGKIQNRVKKEIYTEDALCRSDVIRLAPKFE